MLLLPLDDLLAVTREFLCPQATRSGLDRCLRRHGVGNLNALKPKEPALPHKAFKSHKTAAAAGSFLNALHKACPIKMQKILTDNGKEFTDRLFASRERQATGKHEFDQLCQALSIEHRLTKPRTPQTNGMVERFNGRIADVLKTHRFTSGKVLEQTLMRYVALYNHQ
jgi:transposase-like protein